MPLDFRIINSPMQLKVIEKMEFGNFTKFQRTSRHGYGMSTLLRKRLPYKPSKLGLVQWDNQTELSLFNMKAPSPRPIRQMPNFWISAECLEVYICRTHDNCHEVLDFLKTFDIKVQKLEISQVTLPGFYIGPDFFITLMEICKAKSLYSKLIIDEVFMSSEVAVNLEEISCRTPLKDEILLKLKATTLFIQSSAVTSKGINSLLKMWLAGEREIKVFEIYNSDSFHMEVFEDLTDQITPVQETMPFTYSYTLCNGKEKLKVTLENTFKITLLVID